MAFGTLELTLRPLKLAFLVDPADTAALTEAIQLNTFLWGGMFNPIVPVFRRLPAVWRERFHGHLTAQTLVTGYLDAFDPDFVVTVGKEALDYFALHHDQSSFSIPCPQVVEAFLADRKLMGNSAEDIATLRSRLHRFAAQFAFPLRDITKEEYRNYFAVTGRSLRDRRNHRSSVGRLVNWARDHDYLPADHPGVPGTGSRVRIPPKQVQVFDREQRELLIAQARPVELPLTLLRAYIPIRSKECALVSWQDINWKTATLTVYADKAKTRESRSVSLVPQLLARLEPHRKLEGQLYPFKSFYRVGPRLARKAGLQWIRNGWRCSAISYLQAIVRDLGRVADEAGNSPTQIRRCYLKNLDAESGRAWFGLKPDQHHPVEPVRQIVEGVQQRSVPIHPVLVPANVIQFASAASQL